jgi:dGTPase
LFQRYSAAPESLPSDWRDGAPAQGSRAYARHVADFIAGMTDRFAFAEHGRLFDVTPDLR